MGDLNAQKPTEFKIGDDLNARKLKKMEYKSKY